MDKATAYLCDEINRCMWYMWKVRPSMFHYEIQGTLWKWMYGVGWWQIMSLIPSSSTSWLTQYGYLHIIATSAVGQIRHGSTLQHDGTTTSPQYTLHFLKSEIPWSVDQMKMAHYMATQITGCHPTGLLLWRFMMNIVYQQKVQNVQVLRECITNIK